MGSAHEGPSIAKAGARSNAFPGEAWYAGEVCTFVVLNRVRDDLPLVLAANRDEIYAREAEPPQVLVDQPRVIGGRDVRSGGTWLGVTPGGFFAGVTNQRTYSGPDPSLESRGPLVVHALELGNREAVRAMLERLDPGRYNSFNLIYGDASGVEVAYGRREAARVEIAEMPPGLHVVPNDRIDSPEFPKVIRLRQLIEPALQAPWPELRATLVGALADHEQPPPDSLPPLPPGSRFDADFVRKLHAVCIHTPNYGTRSATLLALTSGAVADYEFAPGPPCTTPFADAL